MAKSPCNIAKLQQLFTLMNFEVWQAGGYEVTRNFLFCLSPLPTSLIFFHEEVDTIPGTNPIGKGIFLVSCGLSHSANQLWGNTVGAQTQEHLFTIHNRTACITGWIDWG